jgi:hypothetical protein
VAKKSGKYSQVIGSLPPYAKVDDPVALLHEEE